MKLHNYETFINEGGKWNIGPSKLGRVDNKVELKKGDCVVITADEVDPRKDIDYSRTAKSWFGRNITSLKNHYKSHNKWYKGNVILISDGGDSGYIGGFSNEGNEWGMSPYKVSISRENEEYRREMVDILIDQGMAEVVNYEDLPEDFRKEFESDIKDDRISSSKNLSISGDGIGMRGDLNYRKEMYKVIEYKWLNGRKDSVKLKVVVDTKVSDFVLSKDEVNDAVFMDNGKIIDGDPFSDSEVGKNRGLLLGISHEGEMGI